MNVDAGTLGSTPPTQSLSIYLVDYGSLFPAVTRSAERLRGASAPGCPWPQDPWGVLGSSQALAPGGGSPSRRPSGRVGALPGNTPHLYGLPFPPILILLHSFTQHVRDISEPALPATQESEPARGSPPGCSRPPLHTLTPRLPAGAGEDAGLYDAPIWMLCCYALSQLPGQRGSLAAIHATLIGLLSGHVVLPWAPALHKYLATSSLDGRGIQRHAAPDGQREFQLHEDCIPAVLRPGWLHFKRWASLQTQSARAGNHKHAPFSTATFYA